MIYTYNGLKEEIQNRLSLMSSWNTTLYFGVYTRIIDLLAYTANKLVYLAEFLYRESKWVTVGTRKAICVLAKLLDYKPYRKSGAIGNLTLSASSTFDSSYTYTGSDIFIGKWIRFTDVDETINVYCTTDTQYYTGTVGSIDVPVREGIPKQFLYIANGTVDEEIRVYSTDMDEYEVEVLIVDDDNITQFEVNQVSNLYLVNDLVNYTCQVDTSVDQEYVSFTFGDDLSTKKLAAGTRVLIKYADTTGFEGNINTLYLVNTIKDLLYDESGTVVTLYVRNEEGIFGGSEAEDIESIRNNANNLFATGNLLSSRENWMGVINSAPFVNKSIVWTLSDLGGTISGSDQNVVYVTALSTTGGELTETQEDYLLDNFINPRKSLTEAVSFEPLEKIYARFNIIAKIQNRTAVVMDLAIKSALTAQYSALTAEFQTNIYESNFYATINSVTDVVYHESDIYYLEKNKSANSYTQLLTSYTTANTTNPDYMCYLVADSFEIWVKLKIADEWGDPILIATTSGTTISAVSPASVPPFTITGYNATGNGSVNYTTNIYSFQVLELYNGTYGTQNPADGVADGYVLSISYKMEDGNTLAGQTNSLRLPYFKQITDVDTDYITTSLAVI